ncbi:MAG: hypothetical protein Q4F64_10020 [Corynebacterium casei]|nr:hypothetical protein [Corynebacterium casei]
MTRITSALISIGAAAALALTVAPAAHAQSSLFSLSSSSSPSGPSKPGNDRDAKVQLLESRFAAYLDSANGKRTVALNAQADQGITNALNGLVTWTVAEDGLGHAAYYDGTNMSTFIRFPVSALDEFLANIDDLGDAQPGIEAEYGLAADSDSQYVYIVFVTAADL